MFNDQFIQQHCRKKRKNKIIGLLWVVLYIIYIYVIDRRSFYKARYKVVDFNI